MRVNYATIDNRELLRLADTGDTAATDELSDRGNTVVDANTLSKTILGSELIGYSAINPGDVVKIHNGKVVEVNGNPYP